ncbi:hypothetical protein GCM10009854_05200 [Saccharopolyspora halophila]|uniref:Transcriptional regulator WhiB n=1 Tax=Saccharopolyspora halophila TaxID=405551 RepID=A0ABN3FM94_9PSEU
MFTASVPIADSAEDSQPEDDSVAELLETSAKLDDQLPCRRDPDLWFADRPADLERAKTLCADCPLKDQCLAGALARSEPWGVWGGEIFEHGRVVARKRGRGRPRKHPRPEDSRPAERGRAA